MRRLGLLLCGCAVPMGTASAAVPPPSGAPFAVRFNATGHALVLPAELKDGEEMIGEVPITIGTDDAVSVDRGQLTTVLQSRVSPEVLTQLATISPGQALIPVTALGDVGGAKVVFNPGMMRLELEKKAATSGVTEISYSKKSDRASNYQPAAMSAFVNVTSSVDTIWDTPSGPPVNMNLEFEGAARLSSWVIEGQGRLDGPLDNLICPAEADCAYTHKSGFKRTATRLVKEMEAGETVLTMGDISYVGFGPQRGNDLLGVGLVHDAARFGEDDHLRAATSLLSLDSPADVVVLVNGAPLEHLHLNTGSYRISDLRLLTGSNTVQLLVTTADGKTQTIILTALAHDTLLKPGKSQWGVNAGVASFVRDAERAYQSDDLAANGYFRYGLSPIVTGDIHGQTDSSVAMVGGDVLTLTPWGLFSVGLSASMPFRSGGENTGWAVTLAWDYLPPAEGTSVRQSIHLGGAFQTSEFTTPGDQLVGRTGILYPTLDPEVLLAGSWTAELLSSWVIAASARLVVPDGASSLPGAVDNTGTRWGGDLSLTVPLAATLQGTLWCSYGNEHLLTFNSADTHTDFTVGTRVAWRPDSRTDVSSSMDSSLKTSAVFATRRSGSDSDGWQATFTGIDNEQLDSVLTAGVSHQGRFEETSLVQSTGFDGNPTSRPSYEHSSLRTTTAVAYADGHVALGRPIRDGFAIVAPHVSLPDSEILLGDADAPTARASASVPALVSNLPAHVETRLAVDASNLPRGYSLGDGAVDVTPPYHGGYAIEIGSDHALTVYGVLLDETGAPVALAAGTATSAVSKRSVALFTNGSGRYGVEGLSTGAWIITVRGPRGPLTYNLTIPDASPALIKTGPLTPNEKGPTPHAPWTTAVLPVESRPSRMSDAR